MKTPTTTLTFPPFRLDPTNACLWRGAKRIALPPKDFAVLHHLVTHAGQLVTHAELLEAVWPDAVVSSKGLKVFVRRLRQVLGDQAAQPRFIETVHGQGYRFLPVVTAQPVLSSQFSVSSSDKRTNVSSNLTPDPWQLTTLLVGREAELAQLHRWLAKAQEGERQLVFVTGEPGIGKTSFVEKFLWSLESRVQSPESQEENQKAKVSEAQTSALSPQSLSSPNPRPLTPVPWLARGQCIEQYGAGEPYLPVLDALGRLCRGPLGASLLPILRQHAPMWLLQLPALLSDNGIEDLQRRTVGATQERMLREIAEAFEVLTAERTLVLVLEDLHWADVSTLELLALLARRPDPARLLVIGTYRPLEVLGNGHPLNGVIHELHAHGLCEELALGLLSEEDVATYLQERFPHSVFPLRLAEVLHRRTEGNPLFVVSAIDDLVGQGMIVQVEENWVLQGSVEGAATGVPENIRHLVARQRERLEPAEQQVLEAASVAGMEFSVAAVAAALEAEVVAVGEHCAQLAERQQFLRPAGIAEWPDGTVAARYGFVHALYQHVWSERVSIERQQQWHLRVGERKEKAYGSRASEIAAELAVHFEQGRDYPRVIRYLQQAGESAVGRHAYPEAIALLTQGLTLLQHLPETSARWRQEFALRMRLSPVLMATKGYTAPEVEDMQTKALALSQQIGDDRHVLQVLSALLGFYLFRSNLQKARECGEQCLDMGRKIQSVGALLSSHHLLGVTLMCLGEFVAARSHLEEATALYRLQQPDSRTFRGVDDPGVGCHLIMGLVLWFLGYPDQALRQSREALALAHKLAYPLSLASAFHLTGVLHELRGEVEIAQERAEALIALATEQGTSPYRLAGGRVLRGWTLAEQGDGEGGLAQVRHGLTIWESAGSGILRPYALAVLAEVYLKMGQNEKGLAAVKDALVLVNTNGEHWYEAELYRLLGSLSLPD